MNKPSEALTNTETLKRLSPEQIKTLKDAIGFCNSIAEVINTMHILATQLPLEQRNALLDYIQLFLLNEAINNNKYIKDITDALAGLLPIAGDLIVPAWVGANIYSQFKNTGIKPSKEISIVAFIKLIDFLLGLTPGAGDLGDAIFPSNVVISLILEQLLAKRYLELNKVHEIPQEISQAVVSQLKFILHATS